MNQANLILKHLKSGQPLTPLDALKKFGTLRLGARVLELRQAGHPITTKMVKKGGSCVAEYRYVESAKRASGN